MQAYLGDLKRDLAARNILLKFRKVDGRTTVKTALVSDFGMARMVEKKEDSDANMTMSNIAGPVAWMVIGMIDISLIYLLSGSRGDHGRFFNTKLISNSTWESHTIRKLMYGASVLIEFCDILTFGERSSYLGNCREETAL